MPLDLFTPDNVVTFLTLTFLEIVLAGDNLVLIAILANRLPEHQRALARRIGLIAAVVTRLGLLFSLFWLSHLETPLAIPLGAGAPLVVTPRQIVFGVGGAFLIWKSLAEILAVFAHSEIKMRDVKVWRHAFAWTIVQIAFFDLIFSLDSVIAAIGIAQHVEIMAAAVITATLVMIFLVNPISNFIERYQIVKLIALNLLTLIGVFLVTEAAHIALPSVYFYAVFAVAVAIQIVLLWVRSLSSRARLSLTTVAAALAAAAIFVAVTDPAAAERVANTVTGVAEDGAGFLSKLVERVRQVLPTGH